MRRLAIIALLVGCEKADQPEVPAAAPKTAVAPKTVGDPAHVAGTWRYRTESNCGSGGTGSVRFRWDAERALYREDGDVTWPDTQLTVRWWGDASFEPGKLVATIENSLGDKVTGNWRIEPDRLVVEWNQTNGCHGTGTATR